MTDNNSAPEFLAEAEFVERFVAELVSIAPNATLYGCLSVEEYAREVAPTYWSNVDQRADGPEVCAGADYDCWELE